MKKGDHVKAGDPLVELDETRFITKHDSSLSQYRSLEAQESRLIAERDGLDHIEFSPNLLKDAEKPEVAVLLHTERHVFEAKKSYISTAEKQIGRAHV